MDDELTPDDARAALDSGTRSARLLRAKARWAATKLTVYGLGFGLLTAAFGLIDSTAAGLALFGLWGVLVALMTWWERQRRARLPRTPTRIAPFWMLTIIAYAITVAVGAGAADPGLAYWLIAAAIVAAPMLIGAVREARA